MPFLRLANATWTEVERALSDAAMGRRVAVLPCGATEAHGPHLGLLADVTIATAMAEAGAAQLDRLGWTVLVLPALPFAPVSWADGLPGTVGPSAETFGRLVQEVLDGAWLWGVDVVAIANAHFDPLAVTALRAVEEALRAAGRVVAYPDLTRRRLAARLGEEFRSGACHAGRYETSIVLAADPATVRQPLAAALPARDRSLVEAMAHGARSFAEIGAPDAWVGRPAEATAEEGEHLVAELGAILAEAVVAAGSG